MEPFYTKSVVDKERMMSAFTCAELGIYRENAGVKTIPLATALAWSGIMKRKRKKEAQGAPAARPVYMKKMLSGPTSTFDKGLMRANLLFKGDFSKYVAWLIEEDYARDQRVVMTVAEGTEEYLRFREQNPPMILPRAGDTPRTESRQEGDD